jgi:spermidine synthase
MYHVIGTGLTAIILYSTSYFLYRAEVYSITFHRRLWNLILAAAFLLSAIAGVFLALQVTYKWEVSIIKTILKWHVEIGIGMAITGLFHLLWHLPYFSKIFSKTDDIKAIKTQINIYQANIGPNLFITGFVSTSIQLLLIREVMNITGGYELITGTFLGSWLIVSAAGAALAQKSPLSDVKKINLIFSLSPLFSLFLLLLFSRLFLTAGETPSFLVSFIYTFIFLIPYVVVSGFTFIKLISYAGNIKGFVPGKSFSIETAGGITSGIVISLLSSRILDTYQIILLTILLSIAYVILTFYIVNIKAKIYLKVLCTIVAATIILFNPDVIFRRVLLPGIEVISTEDTPYGNITTGNYKGEKSVYYNQRLQAYSDDVAEREEDIHYAMLQTLTPEKVLMISGDLRSHLPEILKYPVNEIIYIERDPALAGTAIHSDDNIIKKLTIKNKDAFSYINSTLDSFDAIILLVPPPSTLLLNRYYTTEFFSSLKKRLRPGGVFLCSPGPGDTYLNAESESLYSSITNSLKTEFKNVRPVVGNKFYLIASDKEISVSFCRLADEKNIRNTYVSSNYLSDEMTLRKTEEVTSILSSGTKQNLSLFPSACFHLQSYFISKTIDEKIPSIILLILIFAGPVMLVKRGNLIMYFSASALAGFEIIILLTIQLIIGNMYQITGLVISGLMAGLAIGAGMEIRILKMLPLKYKGLIIAGYYLVFGLFFNYIILLKSGIPALFFIMVSAFIPALVTGSIFRELSNKTGLITDTASVYSADLAGSSLGFILITAAAIPSFGIQYSVFSLSGLILTGLLFGTITNK